MFSALWNRFITYFRPDKVHLEPVVDYDGKSATLKISLEGKINGKSVEIHKKDIARGKGVFGNRRFMFDKDERKAVLEASKACEWIDEGNLFCRTSGIPRCLPLLREKLPIRESPASASIGIHPIPLEHRTYLELDDPEKLIIRQNFVSSEGHTIQSPDLQPAQWPEWLNVSGQFFKAPSEKVPQPKRGRRVSPGTYELSNDEIPEFLESELTNVRKTSRILADSKAADLRVVPTTPALSTNIDLDEKNRQVVVRPQYSSGNAVIDHKTFQKTNRGRRYLRRANSFHKIDWKQVDTVEQALLSVGLQEQADGTFRAPSLHYDEIINIFSKLGILAETEVFKRFRERLLGFANIEDVELPSGIENGERVRSYQRYGYDWLVFLKNHGLPGILADEMGLGKTLQMLLAVALFQEKYGQYPSLVVCPAALVEKWGDEAEKFFPELSVLSFVGTNRKHFLKSRLRSLDLVMTSFETLVRDVDELSSHPWRFLIVDEAQKIKNPDTMRAKAIRRVPAEARIAITGTPVENRLRDLWAIFDFLAPGYLGSEGEFERKIGYPIEQYGDPQARGLLLRKTHPFILRRLKKSVASELPDKIEKTIRCDLSPLQRSLYKAVISRDLEEAIKAVGGKRLSIGNPHIFAVLTKLKQICCHPGLITGEFDEFNPGVSGKFDSLVETFEEIIGEEASDQDPNKLVVFSQYVRMATFIQDFITSKGRHCDRIDGSVPPTSRPALCKAFNANASRFGMVSTLFSGGLGLDLPSANHVMLYDQWWNPAVHDQAVDRVHRIGQERNVLVFYFITRGTLEEKIEAKLLKKRNIFDLAIRPDDFLRKEITREELLDLVRLDS